jgi:hypothetical protein
MMHCEEKNDSSIFMKVLNTENDGKASSSCVDEVRK